MTDVIKFASLAPVAARIGVIGLFLPIACIAVIVLLGSQLSPVLVVPVISGWVVAGVLSVSVAWRASAYLLIAEEYIVVGFFPLRGTRILLAEVAEVSVTQVDPFVQYRGWGIKGSSKTALGRFYSAGGEHSVLIKTDSGKTFLVGFANLDVAREAEGRLVRAKGAAESR